MKLFTTMLLLGGSAAAFADRVIMEDDVLVADTYTNWASVELAESDKASNTMDVFFMMKHDEADLEKLEKTLYAVSDPDSPAYGNHLSLDEVRTPPPLPPFFFSLLQK